mgnify:CR=1 FL=1
MDSKGEKKMKKFFKLAAASVLSVSLLAACSNDSGTNAGKDKDSEKIGNGDVELVFWEFGNTGYDKLIEEYVAENPHVTINLQNSDMNDLHDNLFTSISAGTGAPDITMIEEAQIERYRNAEHAFTNLFDFGAKDVAGNYLDWVWKNGENADGSFLFGLPTDIGPTVMFYRTDVFEEAGLESSPEAVSELIQTWEDYEKVAQQIKEKTGKLMTDSGELIYNARRDQSTQQYFNTSDELIIEDHNQLKDAFNYVSSMLDQGLVGDIPLWTPEWFAGMGEGTYATMLAPAWMQGVIKDNSPENGVWSITTMPEGAGNWGGSYLTVPAESKNAEEAYKFIAWLTAPEQQLKAFLDYGLFPSAPAVYDMPEFKEYTDEYFGGIATAQVFSDAAQQVEPVYKGRLYYPVDAEVKQAIDNVAAGKDSASEWAEALERMQRVISRQ